MRFYPTARTRRLSTIAADVAVVLSLVLFAWLGVKVHDAVAGLAVLGRGLENVGTAVESGFVEAAEAVVDTPLVGDDLDEALRDAGRETGGEAAETGRESQQRVDRAAKVLGVVTFLIPAVLILGQFGPRRVTQIRRLSVAGRALGRAEGERARLIAMRAAFTLPYADLLRHTSDPFGDLAAGRYDALLAAAYEHAGVEPDRS